MAKVHLQYPYSEDWDNGYLVINGENRRTLILYNSHTDRSSTQYARYLLAVSLGRYLGDHEHVDHIDNDRTNDDISNLQILSKAENNKKAARDKGRLLSEIKCPVCSKIFTRRKGNTQAVPVYKGRVVSCSRACANQFKKLTLTHEERLSVSEASLIRVFKVHI